MVMIGEDGQEAALRARAEAARKEKGNKERDLQHQQVGFQLAEQKHEDAQAAYASLETAVAAAEQELKEKIARIDALSRSAYFS